MHRDLAHLPQRQQEELAHVEQLLLTEFAQAIAHATQPWKRNGKILKIILFGSHARDDWIDEPQNGYQSDFDLLVIVSHPDLTDVADYWYIAEDKMLRDPAIGRLVNIIVHPLGEVNDALVRGEYFWVDVARDGIVLYELPGHPLATPQPLTPADAYAMASGYFDKQFPWSGNWLKVVAFARDQASTTDWLNMAAFNLHQAAEAIYTCFLLVFTLYSPKSHNIKFLRSLAEDNEPRLIEAWPRATKLDRRRFELLKRAYVEARYSPHYAIGREDLDALLHAVRRLREIVEAVSHERLEELRVAAGA